VFILGLFFTIQVPKEPKNAIGGLRQAIAIA
jgi:hypothetical protein